ncbi:MAG: DUF1553 domain-containing protein [Isosphaeraceae bacterium]
MTPPAPELDALLARLDADLSRHGKGPATPRHPPGPRRAAERIARLAQARLAESRAARKLADAERKPHGDTRASSEQAAAQKALDAARKSAAAALASWTKAPGAYTPLSPTYPARSTGRRTALARWMTAPENPLTARVAMNHLWRWHFQQPLVASTHDFGRNGKRPTHPALLDWLASEFVARGWSMKAMHRLIVTSAAYRMSSRPDEADGLNRERDPENTAYWRFNTSRMESEVVRDGLLAAAGVLDPAIGGPDIDFNQGFVSRRRSLYLTHHGEGRMPFLELFDAPDACEAYTRTVSVVPQQSLALTNNELARSLAKGIAERVWAEVEHGPNACCGPIAAGCCIGESPHANGVAASSAQLPPLKRGDTGGSPGLAVASGSSPASPSQPPLGKGGNWDSSSSGYSPRFITVAFEQVLSRRPSSAELERSLAFLEVQEKLFASTIRDDRERAARAQGNLVHVLFNHHDFLTIH